MNTLKALITNVMIPISLSCFAMHSGQSMHLTNLYSMPTDLHKLIILAIANTPIEARFERGYIDLSGSSSNSSFSSQSEKSIQVIRFDLDQNLRMIRAIRQTGRKFYNLFSNPESEFNMQIIAVLTQNLENAIRSISLIKNIDNPYQTLSPKQYVIRHLFRPSVAPKNKKNNNCCLIS